MRSARSFDPDAFARDLSALRAELEAAIGDEDWAHFRRMARWGRACTTLGYATAWIAPNPISAALLSLGTTARWAIVMHHVGHRGLDRVPGATVSSKTFALGGRRARDWLDWMLPEAWNYEHNVLHHYRTGEIHDPDLVEHNMQAVRDADVPRAAKWAIVAFYACTWKLTYYAPSTWSVWRHGERAREARRAGLPVDPAPAEWTTLGTFDPRTNEGRAFLRSLLPYALRRFVLAPAAFLSLGPLGPWASASVLANTLLAELLGNLHTFLLIAPNHSGDDLFRFDAPLRDRAEFHVRQVVGSASYTGGTDLADFLQGFLNYQIEHHLWPDLPPLKYRQAQPRVREICAKHGVPYVQESVFARAKRLLAIMVGAKSMRRTDDACAAVGS